VLQGLPHVKTLAELVRIRAMQAKMDARHPKLHAINPRRLSDRMAPVARSTLLIYSTETYRSVFQVMSTLSPNLN
jgi:hypothetical protein